VLAPALPGGVARRDRAAAALQLGAAVDAVVHGLKQAGRSSDAIGRQGRAEFAVLAPDADARGARRLGTRLGRAIARAAAPPRFEHPLRLRAGYHAVRDFHRAALGPPDLSTRATPALPAAATSTSSPTGSPTVPARAPAVPRPVRPAVTIAISRPSGGSRVRAWPHGERNGEESAARTKSTICCAGSLHTTQPPWGALRPKYRRTPAGCATGPRA